MNDQTIDPNNIPIKVLSECIQSIQAIHQFKSISYRTIQREIKELFGYNVPLERIEEFDDPAAKDLAVDAFLQYKNQGLV